MRKGDEATLRFFWWIRLLSNSWPKKGSTSVSQKGQETPPGTDEPPRASRRVEAAPTKPRKSARVEMSFRRDPPPGDRRHIRRLRRGTNAGRSRRKGLRK